MSTADFIKLAKHPVKFRMFLFAKIPSAFFSGIRITSIDENNCEVTVPYKWFSKNPFRSTYFACLSMAAEMSTGALAMAHSHQSNQAVSMLVVKMEAEYFKKATGKVKFVCNDGLRFKETIQKAIETGEGITFTASSTGLNEKNETIAKFVITWSFKKRSSGAK
ncbi:MAG: DUF4442 domain-containing protein [Chitinophagaceae bacterium]